MSRLHHGFEILAHNKESVEHCVLQFELYIDRQSIGLRTRTQTTLTGEDAREKAIFTVFGA